MNLLLRILIKIKKFKNIKINKKTQINIQNNKQVLQNVISSNQVFISTLRYERDIILKNFTDYINETKDNTYANYKKIYLINSTKQKIHIGCNTVMKNIESCCEFIKHKIIYYDVHFHHVFKEQKDALAYKDILNCSDIVLFNGEGTLHDSRGLSMFFKSQIAKDLGKKVVLFNTVWQNNKNTQKYLELFDIIATRESLSANEIKKATSKEVQVVPDMIFYSDNLKSEQKEKKIIFTDSVRSDVTSKLYEISKNLNCSFYFLTDLLYSKYKNQNYLTEELIANLSKDSLIVTGRFHVAAFAIKYGIPTIAIPSNTHKIEGLLKDANLEEYLIANTEDIKEKIKEFSKRNHEKYYKNALKYSNNAKIKISNLFEQIKILTN